MAKSEVEELTKKTVQRGGMLVKLYFDMQSENKDDLQPLMTELINNNLMKAPGVVYCYGSVEEPIKMENMQAAPYTSLWNRLEREGRLKEDVGQDGGTFSALNYEPDRPEAEIMQEYVEAWDYLYEPSRYLARAYRYYLAMRPPRRALKMAPGVSPPGSHFMGPGMTWRSQLVELRAFGKILWSQGIRPPYRRQFWTQLIGMLRRNPSRFIDYIVTCAMGEDLIDLRTVVRDKVAAMIKERDMEVTAAKPRRAAAAR